jgi:acetoin utilization deacetylase AcuC-like enzyme
MTNSIARTSLHSTCETNLCANCHPTTSLSLSSSSDFQVSPLSTFEELSTTHDPTYIRRFLEGDQTELEQRNVGFPWSPSGVNRALSSVGGTLAAACFVCDQQRKRQQQQWHRRSESSSKDNETIRHEEASSSIPPPIWAAHIAGGTHHAFYDYGEGFSVFSDMAVAANVILDRYPDVIKNNILLLDVDVHQGNGNAVLFQSQKKTQNQSKSGSNDDQDVKKKKNNDKYSDRVFTFSMHCSGNYFSQKQESDLDIELPIGCQDQAYLMTLNHWLKRFRAEHRKAGGNVDGSVTRGKQHYRWDLIFFQAGVDVLDDDRLGRMALSPEGVAKRNELVYEFASDLGVPLVICMGGGYPKRDDAWESILGAHSDVYFGAHSFLSRWSEDEKS